MGIFQRIFKKALQTKTACTNCGATILVATFQEHGGLCAPCAWGTESARWRRESSLSLPIDKPDIDKMKDNKDTGSLIELLVGQKTNIEPETKYKAAEALGAIGDKRAVDSLIIALNDHSYFRDDDGWYYYVRLKAAEALARIGDSRAADPIISILQEVSLERCYYDVDNYSARTLWTLSDALGKLHNSKAVEPLLNILKKGKGHMIGHTGIDISAFESVIDALGNIGDPRAIEPLNNIINNRDYYVFAYSHHSAEVYGKISEALLKIMKNRP